MCNKIINFYKSKSFLKKHSESIPVYSHRVSAGTMTSVPDIFVEKVVKINSLKMDSLKGKRPDHLAIVTISGDSMYPLLKDKQKVIIDQLMPYSLNLNDLIGKIVIAGIDNDLTIKRFDMDKKNYYLIPENNAYSVIKVKRDYEYFGITGVMVDILQGEYF